MNSSNIFDGFSSDSRIKEAGSSFSLIRISCLRTKVFKTGLKYYNKDLVLKYKIDYFSVKSASTREDENSLRILTNSCDFFL